MKRNARGVTLVTLIVTITIMFIIGSITIQLVFGEKGFLYKSHIIKNEREQNAEQASQDLNEVMGYFEQAKNTATLEEITFMGDDLTEANYGEYVDYDVDIDGDNDTSDDWKIFYTNEEGRIFLIASDYVSHNCSALTTAIDSDHANMTKYSDENYETYNWVNDTDAIYRCNDGYNKTLNQKTADGQPKAQCAFPDLFMSTNYYCSRHVGTNEDGTGGNINARCASALQCTDNWKPFVESNDDSACVDYAIGGPTLEMWIASWNEKHGNASDDTNKQELYFKGEEKKASFEAGTEQTGYYIGDIETNTIVNNTDGYDDTLYFPHKGYDDFDLDSDGANEICHGYWLASPSGLNYDSSLVLVRNDGFIGTYLYAGKDIGVRPIICLKFGAKLTKNEEKSEKNGKTVYDLSR